MNIEIRQAKEEDLPALVSLLSELTVVGNPTNLDNTIYDNIYVAYIDDQIVGTVTLLIEDKIIHGGSAVGHIEDVVVHSNYRKLNIGRLLINYCVELAKERGCYKVILDCDNNNIPFYEKCGFKVKGVCMRYDL